VSIVVCLVLAGSARAAFQDGDVLWVPGSCGTPCGIFDVTAGGALGAGDLIFPTPGSPGQIVWEPDLASIYLTDFSGNQVLAVSSTGVVTSFATSIALPTGLLRKSDGTMLAVSWAHDAVIDVSGGGDFASATYFAEGFTGPRNLIELDDGRVLLADQSLGAVFDISAGGDFTGQSGFAWGLNDGPYDLAQDALGRIYVSTFDGVFDVTAGGDYAAATAHATGYDFVGLTVDAQGRLLATDLSTGDIYDVTAGDAVSPPLLFASGLPGAGDSALDAIPGAAPAVPSMRGPALLLLVLAMGVTAVAARRGAVAR
jgi:hypothetical protein